MARLARHRQRRGPGQSGAEGVPPVGRSGPFSHALLLGMGGSSLCPEVMAQTYGPVKGKPELLVLDSTDPAQVRRSREGRPARTLFIVSSKSRQHARAEHLLAVLLSEDGRRVGAGEGRAHFVAITDPGSKLEPWRRQKLPAHLPGVPAIGGRYSALSNFGLVPAAAMGVDLAAFLGARRAWARPAAARCAAAKNPGVHAGRGARRAGGSAGATRSRSSRRPGIGDARRAGWSSSSPSRRQEGQGDHPGRPRAAGAPGGTAATACSPTCGSTSAPDAAQDAGVDALAQAGHPVVRIASPRRYALGAGVLPLGDRHRGRGRDPRHQPVRSARRRGEQDRDAEADHAYEKTGALPAERPFLEDGPWRSSPTRRTRRRSRAGKTLAGVLRAHLGRLGAATTSRCSRTSR